MPPSSPTRKESLILAAITLFHTQGYTPTTLAQVAAKAQVPVGGVYYHFPTKEALLHAVALHHQSLIETILADVEAQHDSPKARLIALVSHFSAKAESYAKDGDPLLLLLCDMKRTQHPEQELATQIQRTFLAWLGHQYGACGLSFSEATGQAVRLLARLQGSMNLAWALSDPQVITKELGHLTSQLFQLSS